MTVEAKPEAALSSTGGKRCQGHPGRQVPDEQDEWAWMQRRVYVHGGQQTPVRGWDTAGGRALSKPWSLS